MSNYPSPLQVWRARYFTLTAAIRAAKGEFLKRTRSAYHATHPSISNLSEAQRERIRRRMLKPASAIQSHLYGTLRVEARRMMAIRKDVAKIAAREWAYRQKAWEATQAAQAAIEVEP